MSSLLKYKSVEILKIVNNSITNIKFENASILLTGNYLIITIEDCDTTQISTIHNIFNLSEIKSYKTN
jgi:hypothetical protein